MITTRIYRKLLLAVLLLTGFAAAAQPAPELQVRGRLIDIRQAEIGTEVFPQYKRHRFGTTFPEQYIGKNYAVSLKEFDGPEAIRAAAACDLLVALHYNDPDLSIWHPTGESFLAGKTRYYLFTGRYNTPNEWMPLPASRGGGSTLLFGGGFSVVGTTPPPGVVVARTPELNKSFITNPNLLILGDGSYLAACSGASSQRGATFFRSTNRGKSWEPWSRKSYPINFYSLFEANGALYMMGVSSPGGNVIICRSDNKGRTWTFPEEGSDQGVILRGKYHSAPVPVVVHAGRIWRAMETNVKDEPRKAFVLSAPVGSDLLNPTSWTSSDAQASSPSWVEDSDQGGFRQWIEGNVVVAPDGSLVNLLRVDEHKYGRTAAIIHIQSQHRLTFDPRKDIIQMPGGGKKFTIRYDPETRKYWTLVSAVGESYRDARHEGIYASGIHCGLLRNKLELICSEDLRQWQSVRTVIESDNPFFDGFQYVDWQFDGADIVAVIRTAMEEQRGLPIRQHDANMLLFKRIPNFRTPNMPSERLHTLNKTQTDLNE